MSLAKYFTMMILLCALASVHLFDFPKDGRVLILVITLGAISGVGLGALLYLHLQGIFKKRNVPPRRALLVDMASWGAIAGLTLRLFIANTAAIGAVAITAAILSMLIFFRLIP